MNRAIFSIIYLVPFGGTSLPIFLSIVDQRTLDEEKIIMSSVFGMFIRTLVVILGCFAFICSLRVRLLVKNSDNDK